MYSLNAMIVACGIYWLPRAETVEAIEALLPVNINPEQIKL
jgi:hypothetical protein